MLREYLQELELRVKITGDIIRNHRILLMGTMASLIALNIALVPNTSFPSSSDDLGNIINQIVLSLPILGVGFLLAAILSCIRGLFVIGTEPIINSDETLNHAIGELANMDERAYFESRIRLYRDHVKSNSKIMKLLRSWFVVSLAFIFAGLLFYLAGLIARAVTSLFGLV